MMEYCELHKDLSDEEGDNCPLCECMDSKALALGRVANEVAAIRSLVKEMAYVLVICSYALKWVKEEGYLPSEKLFQEIRLILDRPEVNTIMEGE